MNSALSVATDTSAAARYFRVLGDATRLMIIDALTDGERTVGELVDLVGQAQPRISTHLACLRHCGFVTTERRGKEVVYRLALQGLDSFFFQAEDGIRDLTVTGVQTCALPI